MTIDFRRMMTQDARDSADATRREFDRMRALPNRFLAREIAKLARDCRAQCIAGGDDHMADRDHGTYNLGLLWDVLPELAKRLGETEFLPGERQDYGTPTTDQEFRDLVASYLRHSCIGNRHGYREAGPDTNPARVLSSDVANGNIVAVALDRVCPPTADSQDWFASYLREVGRARFGRDANVTAWTPAFQDYNRKTAA